MEAFFSITIMLVVLYLMFARINKTWNKEDEPKEVNRYSDKATNSINESVGESTEQNKQYIEDSMEKQNEESQPDTCGLMFKTLSNLGCQPKTEDDGSIIVQYQGENFHMEFGGMFARIWDPTWAGVKSDDADLSKIREAVNYANFGFGPTIVMSEPNEEGIISLHSRRDIMLHPACPDNIPYVKSVLDSFFDAKENVRKSYKELQVKQMEAQKKRHPIGFNANQSPSE